MIKMAKKDALEIDEAVKFVNEKLLPAAAADWDLPVDTSDKSAMVEAAKQMCNREGLKFPICRSTVAAWCKKAGMETRDATQNFMTGFYQLCCAQRAGPAVRYITYRCTAACDCAWWYCDLPPYLLAAGASGRYRYDAHSGGTGASSATLSGEGCLPTTAGNGQVCPAYHPPAFLVQSMRFSTDASRCSSRRSGRYFLN